MKQSPSSTILEPARHIPVVVSCDVLVAGGGIAGVAAALAASRLGVSVCLVEKTCALGGLATLGNVTVWLPLCDGHGRQVSGGLAEELLKLSVADLERDHPAPGFQGIPACWQDGGDLEQRQGNRYLARFNPSSYLLALEGLLVANGVQLLYDTRACAVLRQDRTITHLVVENKSGRSAVACKMIVDATGDADICFLAGEQTESLDTNVLCGWFYSLAEGDLHLHAMTRAFSPYAAREGAAGPFFRGDDAAEVTAQVLGSRALIREKIADLRARDPASDVQLILPPTIPTFRMTRRLVGEYSLGEVDAHRWFEDTVGLTGDWRKPGPVYAFPMRSLCAVVNTNLLAAGRCMSADTTAWDVTRAIPGCAVTGEAAGTAAALAVLRGVSNARALAVEVIQQQLRSQGALLEPDLVKSAEQQDE
jgi:hypothetical protein